MPSSTLARINELARQRHQCWHELEALAQAHGLLNEHWDEVAGPTLQRLRAVEGETERLFEWERIEHAGGLTSSP